MDTVERQQKFVNRKRLFQTVVDFIVIVIIFIIFAIVYTTVKPKIRYFTCNENDIFYPYKEDTIPFWAVGIFGFLGPLVFIIIVELLNSKILPFQKNYDNLRISQRLKIFAICTFHALSLFLLGVSVTLLLTEIGKRWVGRLRPHFIEVCNPDLSLINCVTNTASGSVFKPIDTGASFCRGDSKKVEEARLSFPSGHASFSTYTMLFLIIYLEARLILLRFRHFKCFVQMAAFIAAFVTGLSRVSDYHHRGSDVVGGTILGYIGFNVYIYLFLKLIIGFTYSRFNNCSIYNACGWQSDVGVS